MTQEFTIFRALMRMSGAFHALRPQLKIFAAYHRRNQQVFLQNVRNLHSSDMLCCAPGDPEPILAADGSPIVNEVIGKADDVPPGTKKMFEVKERKILVINDEGKLYAINGLCSHYNFPLENGVYSKGRIRCPLHGACFNVKTGDIEDYPGFDSLHTFDVKNLNGDLVINTTEKRLAKDRRTKAAKFNKCDDCPIVVIGSGPAAANFIESARQNGLPTPIMVITAEEFPPYDRVLLSKRPSATGPDIRLRDDEFYKKHAVEFKLKTKVTAVDTSRRLITLSTGDTINYSKLVVATGGNVRKLNIPGHNLKNIFYLREVHEANAITAAAKGKHVVCIGASFIGMEIASSLAAEAASVTVISSTPEPLPAFGTDIGAAVRKRFETKGVKIITSANTVALRGSDSVEEVELNDDTTIHADIVIAGIGVLPATEFLKSSNCIELDPRGFIKVDKNFRTTADWVYAIGDAVSGPLPLWDLEHHNIQHFQTAQAHGQMLGYSIVGKPQPRPIVPFFWSIFFLEFGIRFSGVAEGATDIITKGNVEELDFVKYYLKDDRVVAVCNAGHNPVAIVFLELFSRKIHVGRAEVEKNETDQWQDWLSATHM